MVSFKKLCVRFFLAALFAFGVGFALVEVASAANTPPAVPENLYFHARTDESLTVSWTASEGASAYSVYNWELESWQPFAEITEDQAQINAQNEGIAENLRLVQVSGLSCGTTYTLTVAARNQFGQSAGSHELVDHTNPCETLKAPILNTPLNTEDVDSNTEVLLTWQNANSKDYSGYVVQIDGPGDFQIITHTYWSEINIGMLYPGKYFWHVTALRNEERASSEKRELNIYRYQNPDLPAPTPLYPLSTNVLTGGQAVTLTWTVNAEDVEGFWVQVSKEKGDYFLNTYTTSMSLPLGVLSEGKYRWSVSYETPKYRSSYSEPTFFTLNGKKEVVVSPPELVSPISGTVVLSGTAVTFEWTNETVNHYNFELEGYNYLITQSVTGTSITIDNLPPGELKWKVQSEKDNIKSEWTVKWDIVIDVLLDPVIDCNSYVGTNTVKLFFDSDCVGEYREMPLGKSNLEDYGMDNSVSSLFVPAGMSVWVYWDKNQEGLSSCFEVPMWRLELARYWMSEQIVGNSISSIEVSDEKLCNPRQLHLPTLHK